MSVTMQKAKHGVHYYSLGAQEAETKMLGHLISDHGQIISVTDLVSKKVQSN